MAHYEVLAEALRLCAKEFRRENFFADLCSPIDESLLSLMAKTAPSPALLAALSKLHLQLTNFAQNGMFAEEEVVLRESLQVLRQEGAEKAGLEALIAASRIQQDKAHEREEASRHIGWESQTQTLPAAKYREALRMAGGKSEAGPSEKRPCELCGTITTIRCGRCKVRYYCSKACQTEGWPLHKKECKALSARAQDRADGAPSLAEDKESAASGPSKAEQVNSIIAGAVAGTEFADYKPWAPATAESEEEGGDVK
mmetsp:Transcript_2547/g.7478  ORF Transcript_2547/g.7478 Transcript_2547/m.7478 type:complete len:256 (-) Transcript_2547:138-905(-)|eukprot:CAMPEP_0118963654 /NCGR_PEP_ID=MMETSP1173-20130426/1467_1 /TAXON_ID=1034831 /ORGANISM="Rhizochromulina marina cf, Strain CCMP1243" /LENGTH=255 /DNA_ID=CAMNT_0006912005 /DNA_START=10 /DNA_END=777 /DNA_ORIENTATION=-